jgi:hypothetical protein
MHRAAARRDSGCDEAAALIAQGIVADARAATQGSLRHPRLVRDRRSVHVRRRAAHRRFSNAETSDAAA